MKRSQINDSRILRKIIKIKISTSNEEDINIVEQTQNNLDKDSLHPHYKNRFSKKPEFLSITEKSKVSIQIEAFLKNHKNFSAPSNKNSSNELLSLTRDMTENIFDEKTKRSTGFKSCGCCRGCIIV